jgi:hypothetical protein
LKPSLCCKQQTLLVPCRVCLTSHPLERNEFEAA